MLATLILLGVGVTLLANAAHIFTDLGTLGEDYQHGAAINNTSQIAGSVGNQDANKPETSCVEFFYTLARKFSG